MATLAASRQGLRFDFDGSAQGIRQVRFSIEGTLLELLHRENLSLFGIRRCLIVLMSVEGRASQPRVGLDVFGRDAVLAAVGFEVVLGGGETALGKGRADIFHNPRPGWSHERNQNQEFAETYVSNHFL